MPDLKRIAEEADIIVNGYAFKKNNDEIRGQAILNNDVDIKEIKADEFAINEIGKNKFIKL